MIVKERQALFDIAIIASGTAESALSIAIDNDISITDDLEPSKQIFVTSVTKMSTVDFFAKKGIIPATAITQTNNDNEGIEFWAIEDDFVIGVSEGIDFDEIEYDFIIEM
jgi:hypothetical protein